MNVLVSLFYTSIIKAFFNFPGDGEAWSHRTKSGGRCESISLAAAPCRRVVGRAHLS